MTHRPSKRQRIQQRRHALYNKQMRCCAYCRTTMTLRPGRPTSCTLDHCVPSSRGGDNTWRNTVAACAACNLDKLDMTAREYAAVRRLRSEGWRIATLRGAPPPGGGFRPFLGLVAVRPDRAPVSIAADGRIEAVRADGKLEGIAA